MASNYSQLTSGGAVSLTMLTYNTSTQKLNIGSTLSLLPATTVEDNPIFLDTTYTINNTTGVITINGSAVAVGGAPPANSVVEDPFGAGTCLILVGLFFAGKLYKMTLLTISDYYRERFGREMAAKYNIEVKVCNRPEDVYKGAHILAALTDSAVEVTDGSLLEKGTGRWPAAFERSLVGAGGRPPQ